MKLNIAVVIATITFLLGISLNQPYLWIPVSVLGAGVIDLFTRSWVMSERLGSAKTLSTTLKSFLALIGFYAMLGQIACVGLILWWFIY